MTINDKKTAVELIRLTRIIKSLRSPEGCPWDKVQTAESLKPYLLEEAYELLEAIETNHSNDIRDELGDLLLQVVFLAQIYQENQQFDLFDVAAAINKKLIRRHPHVFANASTAGHTERWEQIKHQERAEQGKKSSLADRLPKTLPALKKASKVAKISASLSPDELIEKLQVDLYYLKQKINKMELPSTEMDQCLSDLLYAFVELTSQLHIDAEDILRQKTIQVMAEIDSQIETEIGQELQSS